MPELLNIEKAPYRRYLDMLDALRESPEARVAVAYQAAHSSDRGDYDANELERARLAHILLLRAAPDDVELVRFLLDEEIVACSTDSFQGAGDTLTILSLLTLEYGDASDTWRFWLAKRANFDTLAGGYDIEFVFAQLPPAEVLRFVKERGTAKDYNLLEEYIAEGVPVGIDRWRASMVARYPRTLANMSTRDFEAWAELFGDAANQEYFGLQNAEGPASRAHLYRRLGQYDRAVTEWRAAANDATTPWDQASYLESAMSDAAKARLAVLDVVERLDSLRRQIPSWNVVGLGRMATQACYELAVAVNDAEIGPRVWRMAEAWRSELASFTLVGLQAALAAAAKWGTPSDVEVLAQAITEERKRIDRQLGKLS